MKILKTKINNIYLYTLLILICILLITYFILRPVSLIGYEIKNEFGKAELFTKGIPAPKGMALDKKGRLFVQSALDGKISIINKDGNALDYSYINDYYGYGMDIDVSGHFLLAAGKQLVSVNNSGKVIKKISGFENIYDVEAGPNNTIFVSDSISNIIYSISPDDAVSVFADLGDKKPGSIDNAVGISFDKEYKNLYVLNMYKGELYKIGVSDNNRAEGVEALAANLQRPNYIDVDDQDNAFITCIGDNTVVRISSNGIKELIDTKGKLASPSGIVVSDDGSNKMLYIASKDSNSIYKVNIYPENKKKK